MDAPAPAVQRFSGIARVFVIIASAGFALVPFLFLSRSIAYRGYHIGGIDWRAFLYSLAPLPGFVAVVYHPISTPARRYRGPRLIARYPGLRDAGLNLTI